MFAVFFSFKENQYIQCVVEMEVICFVSIAGYLLCTDRQNDFYRLVSSCVELCCCRCARIYFLFLLQTCLYLPVSSRISVFRENYYEHFRTDSVGVQDLFFLRCYLASSLVHIIFIALRIPLHVQTKQRDNGIFFAVAMKMNTSIKQTYRTSRRFAKRLC